MWMRDRTPRDIMVRGDAFLEVQTSEAYLASLLLEKGELLDSTLQVGLRCNTDQYPVYLSSKNHHVQRTLASSSAWGIC